MIVPPSDPDNNTPNPAKAGVRGRLRHDKARGQGHVDPPGSSVPRTVGEWIRHAARRLDEAGLCFANGLQEPYPEAEYLVLHAFGISPELSPARRPPPPADAAQRVEALLTERVTRRRPAAYVTREAFFAGRVYFVDERVLIPRSRIENLLDDPEGFSRWLKPGRVRRILDLCTGSGCLAIALALAYPRARVDAADLSAGALEVAGINRRRFRLEGRVRLVRSDLFSALAGERYDLIVTNPPYVPRADYEGLPPEYRHEPEMALSAGDDGLALLGPLLQRAADHLTPGGLLVCETGDDVEEILMARWPDLPVSWIPFHFGASGVFAVHKELLEAWRKGFPCGGDSG